MNALHVAVIIDKARISAKVNFRLLSFVLHRYIDTRITYGHQ
jgi:hypothetical protein